MAPSAKSPLLQQKLEDLALVEQSFQEYIEGHYITTEQVLDVLCRLIPESKLIRNSVIALDGYTGFTPVQYRLAELFLVYAKQVYVTVTADEVAGIYGKMGIQNLFYMSRQMAVRLSEIAEKNQVKKRTMGNRQKVSPFFRHRTRQERSATLFMKFNGWCRRERSATVRLP